MLNSMEADLTLHRNICGHMFTSGILVKIVKYSREIYVHVYVHCNDSILQFMCYTYMCVHRDLYNMLTNRQDTIK